MADGGGGEIIIKGGSVELSFDDGVFQKLAGDPRRHKHADRKITRVQVEDEDGRSLFDSNTNSDGLKWTITVTTV